MSLDPFEARLAFLKLLRTLNASQASIAKVVSFAVKYGAKCGDDLWECIVEEVDKASLNARINILYFLDSLAETSSTLGPPDAPYLSLIERGLAGIVAAVVPDTREGVLNLRSTRAILESWRARRVVSPGVVDSVLASLDGREERVKRTCEDSHKDKDTQEAQAGRKRPASAVSFTRSEVLRRIEEDRERQKRLRERMWILPIPALRASPAPSPSPFPPASPARGSPASSSQAAAATASVSSKLMPPPPAPAVAPLDVEFDLMWEGTSDLDDDDAERMRENALAAAIDVPS